MNALDIVRNVPLDMVGYLAALLTIGAFAMRTMIPLRVCGIAASLLFIAFGYFSRNYPVLILHLILLPLNGFRLYQMVQLTRQVIEASQGDLNRLAQTLHVVAARCKGHGSFPQRQPRQ